MCRYGSLVGSGSLMAASERRWNVAVVADDALAEMRLGFPLFNSCSFASSLALPDSRAAGRHLAHSLSGSAASVCIKWWAKRCLLFVVASLVLSSDVLRLLAAAVSCVWLVELLLWHAQVV